MTSGHVRWASTATGTSSPGASPTPIGDVQRAGSSPQIPGFPWWALALAAAIGGYAGVVIRSGKPKSTSNARARSRHRGAPRLLGYGAITWMTFSDPTMETVMEKLAQRLGLKTNPQIFFWSAGLMVLFLILVLVFQEPVARIFSTSRLWVVTNLGWFFVLGVSAWLLFLIWAAVSKYGKVRLGKDGDKPQYSNVSWFTMLFAGGIGTVLMFWGVAEPISHFAKPPMPGVEPFSAEAAEDAMGFAIYHLGLHTWTIFTLPGLAFGYFIYRYDLPMRVSSVFYPFLKEKIYGPIGKTIDVFAILGTLFGLAVSLGLGTSQINAGLNHLFGVPDTVWPKVLIITILTAVATWSIVRGLDKGVKFLSNLNIGMAIGLMLFVLFFGDTIFLLRQLIESVGIYAQNIIPLSFWNDAMSQFTTEGWGWQIDWTVFYWAWTVTWSPFMGVFLARISAGARSANSSSGCSSRRPPSRSSGSSSSAGARWGSMASAAWVARFSDMVVNQGQVPIAIYEFLEHFPAAARAGLAVVIVALFFATSSDSASLVVDMLCTGKKLPDPSGSGCSGAWQKAP